MPTARPALSGWMGHEAPFAFDLDYRPGAGIDRMRVGTPPVIALTVLDAALDAWDGVDMDDVRASIVLCELFIREVEAAMPRTGSTRRATAQGAAARSRSAIPKATPSCRRSSRAM
jgi:kynureninase